MIIKKITLFLLMATALTSITLLSACTSTPTRESTGQFIDSSAITAKVKTKLLADQQLKSLPITVKTYKNEIQLSGFVDNLAQKTRAIAVAKAASGGAPVKDALIIKNP
jgi:hyperosmotically inducible periplasmic protein